MLRIVRLLTGVIVFIATSCDGECVVCDSYLWIEVTGIEPAHAPLDVRACDGTYCSSYTVMDGECAYEEPIHEPAFEVCFQAGVVSARRDGRFVRGQRPPNGAVSIRVAEWDGPVLVEVEGVPELVDLGHCGDDCVAREIAF